MTDEPMTSEECYHFDAFGYLIIRNALTPEGITTIDDDPMGMVKQVPMKAGDVLFFLASAQTHGAFAWQGEMPRRGILMSYRLRNIFPD